MRRIAFGLAVTIAAIMAGPAAGAEGPKGGTVVAAIPANDDTAWKQLEEEQARRRQVRASPASAGGLTLTAAASTEAKAPARRSGRAQRSARPAEGLARAPAARPARPRVQVASVAPHSAGRAAECYRQVGVHVDAAGRPMREAAAMSDARSQEAFIRCVDGRY